jgi:hypothetical protein
LGVTGGKLITLLGVVGGTSITVTYERNLANVTAVFRKKEKIFNGKHKTKCLNFTTFIEEAGSCYLFSYVPDIHTYINK